MKRTILTLLFMFALTLCFASNVIVKNPFYEGKNTEVIEITQVEISDKATTLNVHAHFQPKYWIKIVSATTLIADGKQYALTSAEGIQPDSLFWMPDSGEADFKLIFQPMPKNTSQFNFCEGNEEGAFRIWGIDLTGKVNTGFPIGLPEALKKKPTDGSLPAPIFESGHTKITFHLLADKMALEKEYTLYVNTIFGTQQEKAMKFNSDGVATVEFDQDGTAYCVAVSNYHALVSFWVAPGDNMDVYIDGRVEGYIYQMNKQDPPKSNPNGYAYFTGHYADLNRIADMCRFESVGNDEEYEMSYKMTGDEFMAELSRYYTAAVNNLKAQPCPQMMKEMTIATYQQGVIYAFCHTNSLLYTYSQGSRTALPKDSLNVRLTEKHAKQLANLFDCNSPSLLMGDVLDALFSKSNEMEALYAVSPLLKSLNTAASYMQLAELGKLALTQQDKELLGNFFCNALERINSEAIAEHDKVNAIATPVPDVPLDNLLEAIIAPHKGKVIVIDFWNSWCAPCRAAIKNNEPHKSSDLSSPDIVWIYIANETSPIALYTEMIQEINGIHYRMTKELWSQFIDKYFPEIDGIPAYAFVKRDGTYSLRLDFRDHNVMTKTILEELGSK